jgi:isopenicillin N synthase-like dioxygenase
LLFDLIYYTLLKCITMTGGFLTILAQDDVPGLEVRTRGGGGAGGDGNNSGKAGTNDKDAVTAAATAASFRQGGPASCSSKGLGNADDGDGNRGAWVPAPPRPRALLVNLGDLAAFWSGGALRSTPHRVNIPPSAVGRARHSVVFFCNCDFDAEVAAGSAAAAAAPGGEAAGAGGDASTDGATTAGRYILKKLGLMWE